MKNVTFDIPMYSEEELLDIVMKEMVIHNSSLIHAGFPKWNKDDPRPFVKSIFFGEIKSLPHQYILDTGDTDFVWLVHQMDAMLVQKTVENRST